MAAEWKTELGIKTNPINAFLKNEENARLSQKLAKIETEIDEVSNNITEYDLKMDHDGLMKIIERYEMVSLKGIV